MCSLFYFLITSIIKNFQIVFAYGFILGISVELLHLFSIAEQCTNPLF